MLRFRLFLEQQRSQRALYVFDIDGTLKHPTARVGVKDPSGNTVQTLDHHTFNTHKLKPGHSYDFSEFRSAEKFQESKPIKPMIATAKSIQRNMPRGSKIVFNTARSDFDNKDLFLNKFREVGLNMDHTHPRGVHVHRAGNLTGVAPADAKLHFFRQHLNTGQYNQVHFWDDDHKNLERFHSLKKEYPHVSFTSYHVSTEGKAKKVEPEPA